MFATVSDDTLTRNKNDCSPDFPDESIASVEDDYTESIFKLY